jgi:hypothetical protein
VAKPPPEHPARRRSATEASREREILVFIG